MKCFSCGFALLCLLGAPGAFAHDFRSLEPVRVLGEAGTAADPLSASEGSVSHEALARMPVSRPAEVLEAVPGLVITQHSGEGKANQYFLRGFNLDHGTDFSVKVLGMPINLPSHGHGQGYLDLNFLIPELIGRIDFRKGPYHADAGDFSSAGSARMDYLRRLAAPFAELGVGENGYRRGLLAGSPALGGGRLLYGLEWMENDGPWSAAQNYGRFNALLRYSEGDADNGHALNFMHYEAQWRSTDQVPARAHRTGLIGRYGAIDPSDGGKTSRSSASAEYAATDAGGRVRASAYAIDYALNLFSNFTYFLDHPAQGDQFEQEDRRQIYGGELARTWFGHLGHRDSDTTLGTQLRHDRIGNLGLYRTVGRVRSAKTAIEVDPASGLVSGSAAVPATVREDAMKQTSVGLYIENRTQWLRWLRSTAALRADLYRFDVSSSLAANSGQASDRMLSPKLAFTLGPWAGTEGFVSMGSGFHSNDGRGTVQRVDPTDATTPVSRVDALVRTKGAEVGLRHQPSQTLQLSASVWGLDAASELLFVGDAGTTEASRPSRRRGIELSADWQPAPGWLAELDAAFTRARFADSDPAGTRIPGAVSRVLSLGLGYDPGAWFAQARLRHFGPRALVEDNSVRSSSTTLVNLRLGWRADTRSLVTLDVLNLFDRRDSDIDYFYASCLRTDQARAGSGCQPLVGQPYTGIGDVHTHPVEPRSLRLAWRLSY